MARYATGGSAVRVDVRWTPEVDAALSKMDVTIRGVELERAIGKVGAAIVKRAKELVQRPGMPGYYATTKGRRTKTKKKLVETIAWKRKKYDDGRKIVLVAGPQYPAGAHGHLLERGHRIAKGGTLTSDRRKLAPASKRTGIRGGGSVAGESKAFPFMLPAANDIEQKAIQIIVDSLRKAVGG